MEPLGALSQLQELNLEWGSGQISDLNALRGLKQLERLEIRGQRVSNVSALGDLQALKYLNLDNNQISDFLALNRLTSLNRLSLNGNQITKIPDLSAMRSLEDIGLDQNQITAFEGFEGATVRNISLDGNNISEVLVKELPNLGHLQLRRNPLERLSFAEDQVSERSASVRPVS